MATSPEFMEYVVEQIAGCGEIRYRKMFGEYLVYVNEKPVLLVCDNTVYVKMLDTIREEMAEAESAAPYEGAPEHYILDIDNGDFSRRIVSLLEPVTPYPKKKRRKRQP